ncbi:preprotein translocase subunit YajC [Halovulum sp. GXIMD14793]
MFVTPAYAQAAGAAAPQGPNILILMIPLMFIWYWFLIRPQQKKMKEHQAMVAALRRGDQVITQGGIVGKVTKVKDGELRVEIAEGVEIRVIQATIAQVLNKTEPAEPGK